MSTFTGQKIANSYKNLLQVSTSNGDLSSTLIAVETGAGNTTPLQLATDKVNIGGTLTTYGKMKIIVDHDSDDPGLVISPVTSVG